MNSIGDLFFGRHIIEIITLCGTGRCMSASVCHRFYNVFVIVFINLKLRVSCHEINY